jgi:fatty acyl-CoA reductase
VEQLLRTTDVKRIYVLMRGKAGCTAQDRLTRLLNSGLYHLVRDDLALLDKVHMLEGDLVSDDLGLSQDEQHKVLSEVQVVFHCAASIELEADIQDTLRSNYLGTRRLLLLATQMQQLRCFLHVSTAFVNANQPRGSIIEERLYPLKLGADEVSHAAVVDELMFLDADDANVRVSQTASKKHSPNIAECGLRFMSVTQLSTVKCHGSAVQSLGQKRSLGPLPKAMHCGVMELLSIS